MRVLPLCMNNAPTNRLLNLPPLLFKPFSHREIRERPCETVAFSFPPSAPLLLALPAPLHGADRFFRLHSKLVLKAALEGDGGGGARAVRHDEEQQVRFVEARGKVCFGVAILILDSQEADQTLSL